MFNLKKSIKAVDLASALGLEYEGCIHLIIKGVDKLGTVEDGCLSFSKNMEAIHSRAVLISNKGNLNDNLIISENPRFDFIRCLEWLENNIGFEKSKIPPLVHSSVKLGQNVVIENGVTIGEGTIIEHNAVIAEGSIIGKNCLIRANSSIGSDGFGYERDAYGTPIKFIHLGIVRIGDHVEVGACTCIAKGTLAETVIEDFVKIDNLVHIAHNCIIRKGAFVIACAEVSGGVEIGEESWIAPNSSITQKVTIGNKAMVGLGAVVTKSVGNDNVVAGNPARILKKHN